MKSQITTLLSLSEDNTNAILVARGEVKGSIVQLQVKLDDYLSRLDFVKNKPLGDRSFLDPRLLLDFAHAHFRAAQEICQHTAVAIIIIFFSGQSKNAWHNLKILEIKYLVLQSGKGEPSRQTGRQTDCYRRHANKPEHKKGKQRQRLICVAA